MIFCQVSAKKILKFSEYKADKQSGFTLVETLIALAIFAIIASASAGVLNLAINTGDETRKVSERMQKLASARALMRTDFLQMVPRPARGETGLQALTVAEGGFIRDKITLARFSRRGRVNPGGRQKRGGLIEVHYLLINDQIIRRTWPVIDPSPTMEAIDQVLFSNVQNASVRFLVDNSWQPIFEADPETDKNLPMALELTLETSDFGLVRQAFLVKGGLVAREVEVVTITPGSPIQ